ncbi:2OG-Fe dioxygenase-domain-containing protein [Epithele typhae]|uniref:2OG-Fe dioxygenase-domain-containing protein n=1 Tax=Epithele typhae TaxID=378194 RepID=UPI00200850D9|nr:2OG-Fe dioxygenase-domain-containing protein [Epithele typhae]KAH9915162.1 2OG-Fe dioxygenase-domain-containing protein [Epithele typhae]
MQRFVVSRQAFATLPRVSRRTLASVTSECVSKYSCSRSSVPRAAHLNTSFPTTLGSYRRSFPVLNNASFIRFNPSSDPSFASSSEFRDWVASLQSHFDVLPADPNAPVSAARFRQYSRAFVLPFEDKPRVYWAPGHVRDGSDITYYNQGVFNPEHDSERRGMPSIPPHMRVSPLLEKLILTDVSLCDWSIDELRHPIIVGVHFIKTAPSEKYPVSTTTPNALHQDGHKFSFVHLVRRRNAAGGVNVIAGRGGQYAGLQPEDVPEPDVLARFYLESPLDTWAAYDEKCSHYAGPVMQEKSGAEPSERSVIICDIEPMVAAVCPI